MLPLVLARLPLVLAGLVFLGLLAACSATTSTSSSSPAAQPTTLSDADSTGASSQDANSQEILPGSPLPVTVETTTPPPENQPAPPTEASATTSTYELAEAAFTSRSNVTTAGIDEIFFGDPHEQAAAAARTQWEGLNPEDQSECQIVTPSNGPEGVQVWIWSGRIERVDINNESITTRSGYGIGTALENLRRNLGEMLTITNNDDGTSTALFTPSSDTDNYRIVFEADTSGVITSYRAGLRTLIDTPAEDCD